MSKRKELIENHNLILESDVRKAYDEMRKRNRTENRAKYSQLKREYEAQKAMYFGEGADSEEDEAIREVFKADSEDVREKYKEQVVSLPVRRQTLRKKFYDGEATADDYKEAEEIARISGDKQDIAIFSQLKRQVNAQEAEESETNEK